MPLSMLSRRVAVIACAAAMAGLGVVGCSSSAKESPEPTQSSNSVTVEPTEKTGVKPMPSFEDRAGSDAHSCAPGQTKINGACR